MKKLFVFAFLAVFAFATSTQAQDLLKPFDIISKKKTTYLYLENGDEVETNLKKLDRKKGVIKELKIKDKSGKKITVELKDLKYAYFPQSGWDKLGKLTESMYDVTEWERDSSIDSERIEEGYAYFEKAKAVVKKKEIDALLQLLNPGYCNRIKVFHDPWANETTKVGLGGFTLAGGDDKSFYLSKDGDVAIRIKKKNFKDHMEDLFGDCEDFKYDKDMRWNKFVETIFAYNAACAK